MKDILTAPFLKEMCATTANMYRLGWDERNGGNISYLLDTEEVAQYINLDHVIRTIPTGFDATPLIGKVFIVTGTGKYFKNVQSDPENNLGIIRIAKDGTTAELLWGYADGGKFTSELPAHLMSHMARLTVDPDNRVVMHSHPTYTLAMNYVHELDEKKFTHTLWEMCTECIVVFPDGVGETDRGLIATAYLCFGLQTLIKSSRILGYDSGWYEYVLDKVRTFFQNEYMENGRMKQDLQTAMVLALIFHLTDDSATTGKQLADNVRRLGRLTTGFIGATHLLDALTMIGEDELAVDLLLRTEYPSWLYAVTMGATTIRERWNGMYPDGHFASAGMNSFNHYAYGSVFSWMMRRLAGISPVESAPGYAVIRFAPAPDARIPWVRASIDTVHGTAASYYEKTATGWAFTFTVPVGSSATAVLFGKEYDLHAGENKISVTL